MVKLYKELISDADALLAECRDKMEESATQRAEREKYEKINRLRDNAERPASDDRLWQDF